jgi:steroid delta-isomerase-like uncharacterized protein
MTADDGPPLRRLGGRSGIMQAGDTKTDLERIIVEHWEAWSAHDLDRLLALFAEDLVYEDVTMGVVNRSAADLRAFGEGFFAAFPDVTFEPSSVFAAGAAGGCEWVMRGTHQGDMPGMPRTGRSIEVRGASVFEFDGGRIRRCSDYWDMATFLRQLGLMPPA